MRLQNETQLKITIYRLVWDIDIEWLEDKLTTDKKKEDFISEVNDFFHMFVPPQRLNKNEKIYNGLKEKIEDTLNAMGSDDEISDEKLEEVVVLILNTEKLNWDRSK